jgi:hypothetical protein
MSLDGITALTTCACLVTWMINEARWRARAADLEAQLRKVRATLLSQLSSTQAELARARGRAEQLARWLAGYQRGNSDTIKTVAAMGGRAVTGQGIAEPEADTE